MLETLLPLIPCLGVMFLILGVYYMFYERKEKARENVLEAMSETTKLEAFKQARGEGSSIIRKRAANDFMHNLERKIEGANLLIRPQEYLMISVGFMAFCAVFCLLLTKMLGLALLFGLFSAIIPYGFLIAKAWMRMRLASEQFSDVLDTMVQCFKTGYGLNRALQTVAEKFNDPWGTEFNKIISEINLGATLEDALDNLYERMPTPDVELFVSSVLIQKDTGGNLGELLAILSQTVRNRYQFFRTIKTISAQGKLSALIVSLVPLFLMLMMYLILPEPTTAFLTNPIGIIVMLMALMWMFLGYGVLFKMVQIEV